jgi:hypothetical protein
VVAYDKEAPIGAVAGDPIDFNFTMKKNKLIYDVWFLSALISSWVGMIFFVLGGPMLLLFWLAALVILFVRRRILAWLLLLLSAWTLVPVISFVHATKDYFQGHAQFWYVGLMKRDGNNLDRAYRVGHSSSGCILLGYELFTHPVNNFTVCCWTRMMGVQKGAYRGFYPDEATALRLVDSGGRRVEISAVRSNGFIFTMEGHDYLVDELQSNEHRNDVSFSQARAVNLNNELIILHVCMGDERLIYLIRADTDEVIAKYYLAD